MAVSLLIDRAIYSTHKLTIKIITDLIGIHWNLADSISRKIVVFKGKFSIFRTVSTNVGGPSVRQDPKPLNSSRVQGLLLAARLEGSHEKSSAWVQDRLAPDPCKPYIGGQVRSSGLTINLTPTHRRCGRLAANSSASSEPGALLMPFTPKLARLAPAACAAALTAGCVTNPHPAPARPTRRTWSMTRYSWAPTPRPARCRRRNGRPSWPSP